MLGVGALSGVLHMQKCTAPPYKPVQACIKSFWLQKWLSHFSSVIAVHVSSSDTLEHDRKQAHAVYPSELSIQNGLLIVNVFLVFFLICSLQNL